MNRIVSEVSNYNLTGIVVPKSWYHHIKTKSQNTNFLAVSILADILSWYRPRLSFNEDGTVSLEQKFKGDLLQMSIPDFEEAFNATRRQITSATDLLIDLGLVKKTKRHDVVWEKTGKKLGNVLFWEPVISKIVEISDGFFVLKTSDDEELNKKRIAEKAKRRAEKKAEKKKKVEEKKKATEEKKAAKKNENKDLNKPVDTVPETSNPLRPVGNKGLAPECDNITTTHFTTGAKNIINQYFSSSSEDDDNNNSEIINAPKEYAIAKRNLSLDPDELESYKLSLNEQEVINIKVIKNVVLTYAKSVKKTVLFRKKVARARDVIAAIISFKKADLIELAKKLTCVNVKTSVESYIMTCVMNTAVNKNLIQAY